MSSKIDPEQFRAKLQLVLARAIEKNGRITTEEIHSVFMDDPLSEEQMKLVYDFVLSKKMIVDGYTKAEEMAAEVPQVTWSPEEQRWLDIYEADISEIRQEQPGEWIALLQGLETQNAESGKRAVELLLPLVVDLAKRMYTDGIHLADIVQEGSLGLILAIDQLPAGELLADYGSDEALLRQEVSRLVRKSVQEEILAMLEEQSDLHVQDRKFVEKVEDLKDGVSTLKEEYGRKVYLDEVADFMSISEEEAMDILHLAGEEVPEDQAE